MLKKKNNQSEKKKNEKKKNYWKTRKDKMKQNKELRYELYGIGDGTLPEVGRLSTVSVFPVKVREVKEITGSSRFARVKKEYKKVLACFSSRSFDSSEPECRDPFVHTQIQVGWINEWMRVLLKSGPLGS